MKNIKKILLPVFVAISIILVCSCSLDNFEQYDNFCNDFDIKSRLEECLDKAKKGDTSKFFEDEVKTLYDDLTTFDYYENKEAMELNSLYTRSAIDILDVIEANRISDTASAKYNYEQASFQFAEANSRYQDFMAKYM